MHMRCPQSPGASSPAGAAVKGACEPPTWVLGTELVSLTRTLAVTVAEPALWALYIFKGIPYFQDAQGPFQRVMPHYSMDGGNAFQRLSP